MTAIESTVLEIKGAWGLLFGSIPAPSDNQIAGWVLCFGPQAVKASIARAGRKYEKLNGQMDAEYITKYMAAVLSKKQQAVDSTIHRKGDETETTN